MTHFREIEAEKEKEELRLETFHSVEIVRITHPSVQQVMIQISYLQVSDGKFPVLTPQRRMLFVFWCRYGDHVNYMVDTNGI